VNGRIAQLAPGEELIDPATFAAFYSKVGGTARLWDGLRSVRERRPPAEREGRDAPPRESLREWRDKPVRELRTARAPEPREADASRRAELPPVSPAGAAALEAEIDACTSRARMTRLAVHLCRAYVDAAALFVVHRGIAQGVAAAGCTGRAETALFPLAMPSLFADVVGRGEPWKGEPPRRTLERRVLRALGRESAREIAVLPASLGGRVVSLLYADNASEPIGEAAIAALTAIGGRVARAYERLILAKKHGL
jgi:hypothetical protein